MDLADIAKFTGLAIVGLVSLRAASSAFAFSARKWRSAAMSAEEEPDVFNFVSDEEFLKQQTDEADEDAPAWRGTRKFQIARRVSETAANDICSIYLTPFDCLPLPPFKAGQFLTFQLNLPDEQGPVTRCYSLSDAPTQNEYYRISIKRLGPPQGAPSDAPGGLVSNYFHDRLEEGDIVEVLAPAGEFCADPRSRRPLVLIAGGIGITPMISILNMFAARNSHREVWLFYGVRNSAVHAFSAHLKYLAQSYPNINVITVYSRPGPACRPEADYDVAGYVDIELLQHVLTGAGHEFYVCGPQSMMDSLPRNLIHWGVPAENILVESFGSRGAEGDVNEDGADDGETFTVTFSRSGKTARWSSRSGTLLDLAEANGVKARHNCRAGVCGTCKAKVQGGDVGYIRQLAKTPEEGTCLPCSARPKSDVILDL